MDSSKTLGALGLIATVIFGLLSIYIVLRRRYPGKITFVRQESLGLYDTIIKNFPQIQILYNDKAINEQLVYLKGSFINTGTIDISETMVEEKLSLFLPEDMKWIDAKISKTSPRLNSSVAVSDNKLTFNLGLFRINEFLQVEALAEVKNGKNQSSLLNKSFSFQHRIANTQQVNAKELLSKNQLNQLRNDFRISIIQIILFILMFSFLFGMQYFKKNPELFYATKNETGQSIIVKANANKSGDIELEQHKGNFKKTIKITDLDSVTSIL